MRTAADGEVHASCLLAEVLHVRGKSRRRFGVHVAFCVIDLE